MAEQLASFRLSEQVELQIRQGDLTEEQVDAIVNAANSQLRHGGGVAGAIVRKGGPTIQRESDALAPVPVGKAVLTGAGRLPCRHVIHAVGPRWGEGEEDEKLRSAVDSSLALAHQHGLRSVALPAISSGIFGFPKERCAEILIRTAREFVARHPETSLREIRFVLFDRPMAELFVEKAREQLGDAAS